MRIFIKTFLVGGVASKTMLELYDVTLSSLFGRKNGHHDTTEMVTP